MIGLRQFLDTVRRVPLVNGDGKELIVFPEGEKLMESLGILEKEVYEWMGSQYAQFTPFSTWSHVREMSLDYHVRRGLVTAEGVSTPVAIKPSSAFELLFIKYLEGMMPEDRSYVVQPLGVYFGTLQPENLYSRDNYIAEEWIDTQPDLESYRQAQYELSSDLDGIRNPKGIEQHIDDDITNTLFRGLAPDGRPIFTLIDQFCHQELLDKFYHDNPWGNSYEEAMGFNTLS